MVPPQVQASLDEYQQHWERANAVVDRSPHLHKPLRDSHCRQAVMMWTHHITEDVRRELRKNNHEVPLLPEEEKAPCHAADGDDHEQAVCLGVEQENSCDWCHSTQATREELAGVHRGLLRGGRPEARSSRIQPQDGGLSPSIRASDSDGGGASAEGPEPSWPSSAGLFRDFPQQRPHDRIGEAFASDSGP